MNICVENANRKKGLLRITKKYYNNNANYNILHAYIKLTFTNFLMNTPDQQRTFITGLV